MKIELCVNILPCDYPALLNKFHMKRMRPLKLMKTFIPNCSLYKGIRDSREASLVFPHSEDMASFIHANLPFFQLILLHSLPPSFSLFFSHYPPSYFLSFYTKKLIHKRLPVKLLYLYIVLVKIIWLVQVLSEIVYNDIF